MTTRDKILDAADALFGEVGFDAASVREIAARSGVNKALIHYHFDTKQNLFSAVYDRYQERLQEAMLEALETPGPLRDRFIRLIDTYFDFLAANRGFSGMVLRELAGGHHVDHIANRMAPVFRAGNDLIRREFPETATGALAGEHLLISFFGMVASYFTYGPIVERLLRTNLLSESSLDLRKRHLHRMVDLTLQSLEHGAASTQNREGASS